MAPLQHKKPYASRSSSEILPSKGIFCKAATSAHQAFLNSAIHCARRNENEGHEAWEKIVL